MNASATALPSSQWIRALRDHGVESPRRRSMTTLQVNLGAYCNLACIHCHVEAGPHRKDDIIAADVVQRIIAWMQANKPATLDLTGGAPELIPGFRELVRAGSALGMRVMDRNNLTCFFEPGQEDLGEFLRAHKVAVVASMPCYGPDNVNKQRGNGVFDKSIRALKLLNALGYGMPGSDLELRLVYNPLGPSLPPPQAALEADYRKRLREDFGVEFTGLWCITNMAMTRFETHLRLTGKLDGYKQLLQDKFNPGAMDGLMCRDTVSVDWRGRVYDCDFNQMLCLPLADAAPRHLWELGAADASGGDVACRDHCLGCTAGAGSSCGGALHA